MYSGSGQKNTDDIDTKSRSMLCVEILNFVSKIAVLVVLLFYTSMNVVEGPLKSYLRNSTIIRKNEINVSGKCYFTKSHFFIEIEFVFSFRSANCLAIPCNHNVTNP